jgi:hypothetical protein
MHGTHWSIALKTVIDSSHRCGGDEFRMSDAIGTINTAESHASVSDCAIRSHSDRAVLQAPCLCAGVAATTALSLA